MPSVGDFVRIKGGTDIAYVIEVDGISAIVCRLSGEWNALYLWQLDYSGSPVK